MFLKYRYLLFQESSNDVVECQKPSVDFFKDIFLDNSDDDTLTDIKSEKNSTDPNENDICTTEVLSVKKEIKKLDVPRPYNIFPPKGIFANLNFEDLFDNSPKNNENRSGHKAVKTDIDNINNSYGPLMPESKNFRMNPVNIKLIENASSEDEWVEKTESVSKESSHKHKHSKHKKHKHKHKLKKKSHKHK